MLTNPEPTSTWEMSTLMPLGRIVGTPNGSIGILTLNRSIVTTPRSTFMPRSSSTVSGFTLAIRAAKILSTLSIGAGQREQSGVAEVELVALRGVEDRLVAAALEVDVEPEGAVADLQRLGGLDPERRTSTPNSTA